MKKKGLYFIGIIILLAGAFYYFWPRPGVQLQFQQQPVTRLGEEGRVAVLEYRDFNWPGGFSISGEQFRRQLQALRQAGYTLVTPEEFRDWLQGKKEIKDKSILLTIDDGYASVAEIVPILREFKARALVFLVTSRTGKPKLTDAQLQEFADVLRPESHTHNLHYQGEIRPGKTGPALTSRLWLAAEGRQENRDEYKLRLRTDLETSLATLLPVNKRPEFFAYPYGVSNNDVIQLLKEHGIKFAFGTRPGLVTRKSDPWYLPRFEVGMPSFTPERLLAMLEVEFGKREAFSGWQLAGIDNFQPRIFWLEEGQVREALQITGPGWKFQKITRDQLGPFRRWQLSWEKENGEKLAIDLYSVPGGGMYLLEWTPANQDSKLVYHWQRVGEKGPWQVRTISYRPSQYGPYSQLASMVTTSSWPAPDDKWLVQPNRGYFWPGQKGEVYLSRGDSWEVLQEDTRRELDPGAKVQLHSNQYGTALWYSVTGLKPGQAYSQWGAVASEQLLNWENQISIADVRRADGDRYRKVLRDGIYNQTPGGYEPGGERVFWRIPAQHVGMMALDHDEVFFRNLVALSLFNAVERQNQAGIWPTEHLVKNLKEKYGLDQPFFDTRFNTDTGMFLLKVYRQYQIQAARQKAEQYGKYLWLYVENNHFTTQNKGYLVYDYQNLTASKVITHTSLNHQLAEINFFLELYLLTGEEAWLTQAEKMLQGIRDIGTAWIKPDGDLHYAYLPDGSLGMQDYPLVTLKDLLYTQELLLKIKGSRDPLLDQLISSKQAYLQKQKLGPQ
ncbi:polysaccharide deacetylase family protein [Carboxydocella sp. JDF658]|uniref:polysaccharide deacetylase family protein n=1 Tax=Carboxydocella sp. JDF658 TaxID=1926600 RepID=UPI0009ACBCCE|nr:polysaccharide deacetylase family protein [Carboxydocella sp. JDF658]GAW32943.1 hypothetical protein JDF658_27080 [Carboxydocella sp. JDF658]